MCIRSKVLIFLHCDAFRKEAVFHFSLSVWCFSSEFRKLNLHSTTYSFISKDHGKSLSHSLTSQPPQTPTSATPAPHPPYVITNILYHVSLRGIMGRLIVSMFLLEQDTVQSVFWLQWRMLRPFAWAPVRHKQKQMLIPPSFPPTHSLSFCSHLSVQWPPAINNKTLLSNAESSQAV